MTRLGILQPITVRYVEDKSLYQIITGERRFHAAKEAGLTELPCWIQSPKDGDVLLHQIVENWQRLDMHPFDLADALARLRDANGLSQKEIARATGKSEGEISKILSFLDLNPAVQKRARQDPTGNVTKRHLYALRALPPETQERFVVRVQEEALAAEELETIASKKKEQLAGHPRRGSSVSYHRFKTTHATVSVTFRRKDVTSEDILAALDEVRDKLARRDAGSAA